MAKSDMITLYLKAGSWETSRYTALSGFYTGLTALPIPVGDSVVQNEVSNNFFAVTSMEKSCHAFASSENFNF